MRVPDSTQVAKLINAVEPLGSAETHKVIECLWQKLLVIVMLSTKYPLPAGAQYTGMTLSTLQGGTVVMLSLTAATDLCDALREAAEAGMTTTQVARLIDDVERELTRQTTGASRATFMFAVSICVNTVKQATIMRRGSEPDQKPPKKAKKTFTPKVGGNADNPEKCKAFASPSGCTRQKCKFRHEK